MSTGNNELEKRLWASADNLRANSNLSSHEYSTPVLGLIFLRYAWHRFKPVHEKIRQQDTGRRVIGPEHYKAEGALYLPEEAWYDRLLEMPEGEDIGKAVNQAMDAIERSNPELRGVLPKTFKRFETPILKDLIRAFSTIPMDVEGDVFGRIYEYFLGKFAMSEGQRGGEFFTPTPLVRLIVEIIEPYRGKILDPACGSGGMFVQSEQFRRSHSGNNGGVLSIYGQEKVEATVRLCKMNLSVHGLEGDIKAGNTYYENLHNCVGKFDFVMANPPFNVNGVDWEVLEGDRRYPFGIPKPDNANYLWIQEFYSALNKNGRAGFVMANSASDARGSEMEIRKKLIQSKAVDVMVAVGPNFFYTVTLPCTLWFLDKGKQDTDRADKVLFIDARNIYRQIDRAHREWTPEQIEFLANIARMYRGEEPESQQDSEDLMQQHFPDGTYADVPGLCKVATIEEIEAQGWSLNPGRYVGVAARDEEDFDFKVRLQELNEELEVLNSEARELEERIADNVAKLLEE